MGAFIASRGKSVTNMLKTLIGVLLITAIVFLVNAIVAKAIFGR